MKRFLMTIVFATSIMAGCQKTDIYHGTGTQMQFRGNMVKQTKADGTPSAGNDGQNQNLYAQDFRVWAFQNWDDPLTTSINEINTYYDEIQNLLISYTPATTEGGEGTWDTDLDYYWPGKDKPLKFYAISSANWTSESGSEDAETVTITHDPANSTALGTMTITNFKVGEKADNDLMVADACIQMQEGSTSTQGVIVDNAVTQTFRHALTKVRFNFITTSDEIPVFVQKVETTNLDNVGNLTVTFAEETPFHWTPNGEISFSDDFTTNIDFNDKGVTHVYLDGATTEKTPVDLLSDKSGITLNSDKYTPLDTWLMIPQELANQTITITYILKDRQFKRTFPLNIEGDLDAWAPNQFVNYNVTIAPNLINFDATVEGWNEKDVNINESGE